MNNTNTITLEMPVTDYIDLLDTRRAEVENDFGWTIPDGVYNRFLELLEEGVSPSNPHPRCVIDNLATNRDYTAIENTAYLETLKTYAATKYAAACADEGIEGDIINELRYFIHANREELIKGSGIEEEIYFAYYDPDSKYHIGVCYSFNYAL